MCTTHPYNIDLIIDVFVSPESSVRETSIRESSVLNPDNITVGIEVPNHRSGIVKYHLYMPYILPYDRSEYKTLRDWRLIRHLIHINHNVRRV
jgi:hypothetical protein